MTGSLFNKNILLVAGIILLFFLLPYLFMSPLLEGKELRTTDLLQHEGMAKELRDFRNETGKEGLWTNSMFCGMPGYLISIKYPGNLISTVSSVWTRNLYPAGMILVYLLGFFILLGTLKINRWICLIGAIAFAFSSYFIIIIAAGHTSKAYAIGYLPVIAAGILLAYKGKTLPGTLLYTFGLALEIGAKHYQITYYGLILFFIYMIVEFVFSLKEKQLSAFFRNSLFLLAGTIVAVGINFASIYTVYEYSKQTIRGPSELTLEKENRTSGLNKDYIVRWSQGIDETMTLLIPNFKGGSSKVSPGNTSESYRLMRQKRISDVNKGLSQIHFYHGGKPGTEGPVYAGAIIIFLFVLGLFVLKGRYKWWLVTATAVSIVLSWGKNVMPLTEFLLDHLPFYNKFRAPEMILVVAEFALPLLGIIALNEISKGNFNNKEIFRGLKWSFIITGGITLLFSVLPGIFDSFYAETDYDSTGKLVYPDWLMTGIINDRKELLRNDALRSFLLITLAAILIGLAFYKNKLNPNMALLFLGLLITGDLWFVNKRYLNDDNFERPSEKNSFFQPNVADIEILKDKDISYRVLPLNNPFNNTHYSYYHKNIMGYHAAKLSRPHELMNYLLVDEMKSLWDTLQHQKIPSVMPQGYKIANMLNARYIIYSDKFPPLRNPYAMGNVWFVSNIKTVKNADEEFEALKTFDPTTTALVDQRFKPLVANENYTDDKSGKVELTEYQPNYLKYFFNAANEQFVVFSEVYYNEGWDASIDGKPVPHTRVNYMLRGLTVPAGEHTIEFRFEPKSYYTGNKISLASSILLILIFAGYVFSEFRKRRKEL